MNSLSVNHVALEYPNGGGINTGAIQFQAGQVTTLLGPNGAGKSSLIKALAGAAEAAVDGLTLSGETLSSRSQNARQIAYLSQTRIGPPLARVRDVVALGRYPYGGQDPENRVNAVIDQLALGPLTNRPFGQLSGGEQARVLLGRALAVDAPVLLADEPTASLDPYYALRIMETLKTEARRGRIVIVSVHDLTLAKRYGDHCVVIDKGRVASQGLWPEAMSDDILRNVFRIETIAGEDHPL